MRLGRALLPILICGAGCTNWTFNGNAPILPLVGTPPELSTLKKLNDGAVYASAIVYGADGNYWLALQEQETKLELEQLSGGDASAELDGDQFTITWRSFFVWQNGMAPTAPNMPTPATLSILSAAQSMKTAQTLSFPDGIGGLSIGGADDVFVYVPPGDLGDGYIYQRVGEASGREIPFPGGDAGRALSGSFFSGDGTWFFDRAPCVSGCDTTAADLDLQGTERRSLTAHAIDSAIDITLGLLPRRILLYEPDASEHLFFSCGSDGVQIMVFDPTATHQKTTTLDPSPCASDLFTLSQINATSNDYALYYMIGEQLKYVPIDGSRPAANAIDRQVNRVLDIENLGFVIYSQTPAEKYIYGVGDGWLNDWKFMDRGRAISLTSDLSKFYFLENAAQDGGVGELDAAPLNGARTPLVQNVYQYDLLGDGRLLAAANHAYTGTQNRIVVVDEKAQNTRWVVDQASQYNFIPGSNDIIADIVTGASSYDLVRVPIPP